MNFKDIKIYVALREYNPEGKLQKEYIQEANSLVSNFFGIFVYMARNNATPSGITIKDTTNTGRTTGIGFNIQASTGLDTFGIVVGTNATAVTIGDYALGTKIAHGVGSGQLQYATNSPNTATGTNPITWVQTRNFTNNSGAEIAIAEVGIISYSTYYTLLERTVLSNAFPVANNATCVVQYSFVFGI
jgi:hypothetical protein